MSQIKKYGIFAAITQYLNEKYKMDQTGFAKSGGDITGRFIHRGKKKNKKAGGNN